MKRTIGFSLVGLIAAASLALAQGAKDKATYPEMKPLPGMTEADMQACMLAASPGEMHAHLTQNVGAWHGTGKMWMTPGSEPVAVEHKATFTVVMDGRFVQGEFEGDMGGMPFHGMGLYGYDNVAQRFEATMIGTCSTGTMRGTGELSSDGKTLTWNYEYHCPMTGGPTTMREVEKRVGKDTILYETYAINPETGNEFLMATFEFKRQKGSPISAR